MSNRPTTACYCAKREFLRFAIILHRVATVFVAFLFAILSADTTTAADSNIINPDKVPQHLNADFRALGGSVTSVTILTDLTPCRIVAAANEVDQIKAQIAFRVVQSNGIDRTMTACVCRYPDGTESWTYYPVSTLD